MDEAFKQHSHAARRKNRSSTNLNHLTLAPLTSKLPINDQDDFFADPLSASTTHSTYLQGKSAPTTPRLLSRSPGSRSGSHSVLGPVGNGGGALAGLTRSKSTTHLLPTLPSMGCAQGTSGRGRHYPASGTTSPAIARRSRDYHYPGDRGGHHKHQHNADRDRSDADWLLRAGALIATETRESKGQARLVSRQSSTSLAGMRDPEEEAFERELARERDMIFSSSPAAGAAANTGLSHSQNTSRDTSVVVVDDDCCIMAGEGSSPPLSRYGSRSQSRTGSVANRLVLTPSADQQQLNRRPADGYFPLQNMTSSGGGGGESPEADDYIPGPDFVNLDEKVASPADMSGSFYYEQDTSVEDEAHVRRLVKKGSSSVGAWFGNVLGLRLFPVADNEEQEDEGEEEEEDDDDDDDGEDETDDGGDDDDGVDDADDDLTSGASRGPGPRRRRLGCSRRSVSAWGRFEGVSPATVEERMPPPKADQGGWHDAAWLLTVASKVLL